MAECTIFQFIFSLLMVLTAIYILCMIEKYEQPQFLEGFGSWTTSTHDAIFLICRKEHLLTRGEMQHIFTTNKCFHETTRSTKPKLDQGNSYHFCSYEFAWNNFALINIYHVISESDKLLPTFILHILSYISYSHIFRLVGHFMVRKPVVQTYYF